MSTVPDHDRLETEDEAPRGEQPSAETFETPGSSEIPAEHPRLAEDAVAYPQNPAEHYHGNMNFSAESQQPGHVLTESLVFPPPTTDEELRSGETPRLFSSWDEPQISHIVRIPNMGHLLILVFLILIGWMFAGLLTLAALHFNLYGVSTIEKAVADIHYTLGSMIAVYLVAFIAALIIFPMIWGKGFFAGIQWNGEAALRLRGRLFGAAFICFLFALVNGLLMPGPDNTPIDKIFRAPGAAWMLFAFGITAAPFFEELFFRGFLLPSLCTAFDWFAEYVASEKEWSPPALVAGAAVVSSSLAIFCKQVYGHRSYFHDLIPFESFLLLGFIAVVFAIAFLWFYQRYEVLGAELRVRPLYETGHPRWSLAGMAASSILTSIPFALMHAEQTGYSLGPFVLLVCVSMVLCWARLSTRSLAASVLVHASYNSLLFSFMLLGTSGFQHLDKM